VAPIADRCRHLLQRLPPSATVRLRCVDDARDALLLASEIPMIRSDLLEILCCPVCRVAQRDATLRLSGGRRPTLDCVSCDEVYRIVDGIPDMVPRRGPQRVKAYRTETLNNLIAGTYDFSLPFMSLTAWRCSPLRFVDWTHMALGRAQGGWHLSVPVATGGLLAHTWGPHLDLRVVGVDLSWNMLQRARLKLERAQLPAYLVRADVERLPFRDGLFRSVLSINGLHAFDERTRGLDEMLRVIEPAGVLAGSTLVRGKERMADWVLDLYERNGVVPMLRSTAYVLAELSQAGKRKVLHESYGAVLFFLVEGEALPATSTSQQQEWVL